MKQLTFRQRRGRRNASDAALTARTRKKLTAAESFASSSVVDQCPPSPIERPVESLSLPFDFEENPLTPPGGVGGGGGTARMTIDGWRDHQT